MNRLIAFSASLVIAGCAAAPPLNPGALLAQVEVANHTKTDLWIAVNGRVEDTVRAGSRVKLRYLTPGATKLEASPSAEARAALTRGAKDLTFTKTWRLQPGDHKRWDVFKPGTALKKLPELGQLLIVNEVARDMTVWLNGKPLGTVLAHDRRLFQDQYAGTHPLRASDRALKTLLNTKLTITPNTTARWTLREGGGELVVINDTEESVDLVLDDRALGRIGPREKRRWRNLGIGERRLRGVSVVTRHRYAQTLFLRRDVPTSWGLTTGSAELTVVNHTQETVAVVPRGTLVPSDARTFELAPGARKHVRNVQPGTLMLHAVAKKSRNLHSASLLLRAQQHAFWEIVPQRETVRVINRTEHPLSLQLQGRTVGSVDSNAATTLTHLPHRSTTLRAFDALGNSYRFNLSPTPRHPVTWTIYARTGALKVLNERKTDVDVFVNARFLAAIPQGQALVFSHIPQGRQRIEVVAQSDGTQDGYWVKIHDNEVASITVHARRSFISIANDTGEDLLVQNRLALQQKRIRKHAKAHFVAPSGRRPIQFIGSRTGLVYEKVVRLEAGKRWIWKVKQAIGNLRFVNHLAEAVSLSVDGVPKGTVKPGLSYHATGIVAGRHKLQAIGLVSGRVNQVERRVAPEQTMTWRLTEQPARLLIINEWEETLIVHIDKRPYGIVPEGTHKIFAGLPSGTHTVMATGLKTRVQQTFKVTLKPDETQLLSLLAPRGSVTVDNQTGEAIQIAFDGKFIAELNANDPPRTLPIASGLRLVTAVCKDSQLTHRYRIKVPPHRAVDVTVKRASSRIKITNRTTQPRIIWIEHRRIGRLGPGESIVSDKLPAGPILLSATTIKGTKTHHDRRRLYGGKTATWVLR